MSCAVCVVECCGVSSAVCMGGASVCQLLHPPQPAAETELCCGTAPQLPPAVCDWDR